MLQATPHCANVRLLSTVVGAPHSQNLFEHQQRRKMIDSQTAFRLKDYLTQMSPISFDVPISCPPNEL